MVADSPVNRDSRLIAQAREGSLEAFGELVRNHHLTIRWFLCRYIKDPATVDDLAQDVFVDAMKNIQTLDNDSALVPWLTAIARNKAISFLRQSAKSSTTQIDPDYLLTLEQLRRAEQSEAFGTDYRELMSVLDACLATLKARSRELVRSFYFENQSAEQIAKDSGLKGNTVRMNLLRIRGALAKCIRRKLGEEFEL